MNTTVIINTFKHLHHPSTTRFLMSSIGVFIGVYVVMVGMITFSVVERKGIESEIKMTQSQVGSLELAYLSKTSSMTIDQAHVLGYREISPSYAYTGSSTLSFNN